MYSPKIKEDLIPVLYRLAKREKIPMTKLVDKLLRDILRRKEIKGIPEGYSME